MHPVGCQRFHRDRAATQKVPIPEQLFVAQNAVATLFIGISMGLPGVVTWPPGARRSAARYELAMGLRGRAVW